MVTKKHIEPRDSWGDDVTVRRKEIHASSTTVPKRRSIENLLTAWTMPQDKRRYLPQKSPSCSLVSAEENRTLGQWFQNSVIPRTWALRHEEWIAERLRFSVMMLQDSVDISSEIRGGVPVIKGTRVPVSQVLAEIADDASVTEIADDLDLNPELIRKFIEFISINLDRPFFRR